MTVYLVIYTLCAFITCLVLIYFRLPANTRETTEVGILSLFWPVLLSGLLLASACLLIWHYFLDPLILLYTTEQKKEEEQE